MTDHHVTVFSEIRTASWRCSCGQGNLIPRDGLIDATKEARKQAESHKQIVLGNRPGVTGRTIK